MMSGLLDEGRRNWRGVYETWTCMELGTWEDDESGDGWKGRG